MRRFRYKASHFIDWIGKVVKLVFAVLRSCFLLLLYYVVHSIRVTKPTDVNRKEWTDQTLIVLASMQLLTVFFVAASVPGRFWRGMTRVYYIVYITGLIYCGILLFGLADKSYHINEDLEED